jgi:hypothetical protein
VKLGRQGVLFQNLGRGGQVLTVTGGAPGTLPFTLVTANKPRAVWRAANMMATPR